MVQVRQQPYIRLVLCVRFSVLICTDALISLSPSAVQSAPAPLCGLGGPDHCLKKISPHKCGVSGTFQSFTLLAVTLLSHALNSPRPRGCHKQACKPNQTHTQAAPALWTALFRYMMLAGCQCSSTVLSRQAP